ncbi:hypothetical protein [Neolewinella persica]|uniref:hypothetical protein n=1 Tax=Neolewinella persica TaxID=70998 RepID=UPI0003743E34|nr:hypothetical protein [Neolewinella persica]
MKQLFRFLFLVFLGIQINGCAPDDEEVILPPAEHETTEFFITNLENSDTLLYAHYDDWCNSPYVAGSTQISGGSHGEYFYERYSWGYLTTDSGWQGPPVAIYYFGQSGADKGFINLNNVLETGVGIFNDPNVYFVVACIINGDYYTSHVRSINYIEGVFFTKTDPTAEVIATPELFGNLGNECRISNAFLLRAELEYNGYLYRAIMPTDSVRVKADITFNIGVSR